MGGEGGSGFAGASDDIDDPFGQFGLLKNLREAEGGEAGGFGRFEDNGVAAGQGGSNFPGGHEQGEIPRDDLGGDAERARRARGKGVGELVGPAGVIKEMGGDHRQIEIAAFLDGLAAVDGFEDGQFAEFFLDEAGNAEKVFAPFASRHFAPDIFVGAAGGLHGSIDILGAGAGEFGKFFFGGGVDGVEVLAGARRDEFAADEEFVARGDDVIPGVFRRGGVIPFAPEMEAARGGGNRAAFAVARRIFRTRGDNSGAAKGLGGGFLFLHDREK